MSDENHTVVRSSPPVIPSIELSELHHETVNKNYRVIPLKIKQELQSCSLINTLIPSRNNSYRVISLQRQIIHYQLIYDLTCFCNTIMWGVSPIDNNSINTKLEILHQNVKRWLLEPGVKGSHLGFNVGHLQVYLHQLLVHKCHQSLQTQKACYNKLKSHKLEGDL